MRSWQGNMISDNLSAVRRKIQDAALRCGRAAEEITLVGVTKFAHAAAVNEAIAAGLRDIAENRVQLAEEKFPKLHVSGVGVRKHLIGHLQTNKVKDALPLFDLVHSVDSVKLLDEIEKRAAAAGKTQDILVQLDIAKEEQKFGLPVEDLDVFLVRANEGAHVRVLGLMVMAPLTEDRDVIRKVFHAGKEIFDRVKKSVHISEKVQMRHLSMGMSHDYEIAIEEGSTMVRIGSAIFK
ncbi:MAG: YggS family pyridoxal phosphate-dependent enzyme [Candidatus Omnitrophica bacterium]|nr:YggS family pyridoxal phosphate-dependent enzyme [Candidatus Omnitrophota bacterium]